MAVARIFVAGSRRGIAFAVAPRLVLTASHVVRGYEPGSIQLALDGRLVPVERVEGNEDLDVAALHLGEDVPTGRPGSLTGGQAEWLAYHLCRTGDPSDPARLLRAEWRGAYRAATGSDASYQKALREVIAYYGAVADEALAGAGLGPDQADAWLLEAVLWHAQVTAEVDAMPVDALVAIALSGEPQAALRQAVDYSRGWMVRAAMAGTLEALAKQGELRADLTDLAAELAQEVRPDDALDVLTGMAVTLEPLDYQRALELRRRAVEFANAHSDTVEQLRMSTFEAVTLADRDPDQAAKVIQEVQIRYAAIREQRLGVEATVVVADALRSQHHAAALRLIRRAQAAAEAIVEQPARSAALSFVAGSMAYFDPDEAERLAGAIPDQALHHRTLAALTLALAPLDPQRARRLAEAIPDHQARRKTLMDTAKALTPQQGSVAREFLERAEQLATALTDRFDRRRALAEVAVALAPSDPERARELAEAIEDQDARRKTLIAAAKALTPQQGSVAREFLERAEQLATALTDRFDRRRALAEVAVALAPSDPERARELAEAIEDQDARRKTLIAAAKALTPQQGSVAREFLERAEQLATALTDRFDRRRALAEVAQALAPIDAAQARRMADDDEWGWSRSRTLEQVALTLAAADPTAARKVARAIPERFYRDRALAALVESLTPTSPGEAERLANLISEEDRGDALAALARAVAAQDRQRAHRLVEEIKDLAEAPDRAGRAEVLAVLAEWLTQRVPEVAAELAGRALMLLKAIPDAEARMPAIKPLARALAPHEPAQAAGLADLIPSDSGARYVLRDIGLALVPYDPPAAWLLFFEMRAYPLALSAAMDAVQMLATNSLDEAKRFLMFIPWERRLRHEAVLSLVEALASQDGLRAEQFASSIDMRVLRVMALARLAEVMASRDPARARELAARAQRSAVLVVERSKRRLALTQLAGAWASHDAAKARRLLGRARRVAERLSDKELRSFGLGKVAETLAPLDPDLAWGIVQRLPDSAQEDACEMFAKALVVHNPDKTLKLLETIPDPGRRADAVTKAAQELVAHDPEKALELLQTLPKGREVKDVIAEVVRRLISRDLDKARRLAETITDDKRSSELLGLIAGWAPGRSELAAMTKAFEDPVVALWMAKGFIEGREHLAPATVRRLAQSVRDAILRPC